MRNKKLLLLFAVLIGLLMVVAFGCKKKEEEKGYEISVEEPKGETETKAVETPVEKISQPETVIETMSIIDAKTAIDQAVECYDASIVLLGWPENEYLVQQLLVKNSTLLGGLVNAFEGSKRTIIDNAITDTDKYISRLDSPQDLGSGEVDTMKTTLRKHRRNLEGLYSTPVVQQKDKKLKDFYTEAELEAMKKKWKEYGDELKKKYKEEMEKK
jgi:hypothetical protein